MSTTATTAQKPAAPKRTGRAQTRRLSASAAASLLPADRPLTPRLSRASATAWNRLYLKLATGREASLQPIDHRWLAEIGAAAVGLHDLAQAASRLLLEHTALGTDIPEGAALRESLIKLGYLPAEADQEGETDHE